MTTSTRDEHQPRTQIAETVFQEVRRVVPEVLSSELNLTSSLSEVGLDSLQKMDVVNALEKTFRMRFKEEWLYDMETCGDLVARIELTRRTVDDSHDFDIETIATAHQGALRHAAQPQDAAIRAVQHVHAQATAVPRLAIWRT